jgi:hypothetical protein
MDWSIETKAQIMDMFLLEQLHFLSLVIKKALEASMKSVKDKYELVEFYVYFKLTNISPV